MDKVYVGRAVGWKSTLNSGWNWKELLLKRMEHVSVLFRRLNTCDPVPCNIRDMWEQKKVGRTHLCTLHCTKCGKGRDSLFPPHMRLYAFPSTCFVLPDKHSSTISRWKFQGPFEGKETRKA